MTPATKLVGVKSFASTLTRDHAPVIVFLQRPRTRGEQIRFASDDGARAFTLVGGDRHGDVKAVDEADGVGGLVGVAVLAGAVAGGAGEVAVFVGAVSAGPEAAGPVDGGGREGAVGVGVESEASAFEDGVAGVGLDGRPDGEGAVVYDGEDYGGVGVGGG
ncbi:hypothetical protein L1987_22292 [Smallanthus sonchifolius]|uniref:Uncharacterized protein n=1 Tax=Smallanthus sonchifolius TaxID=185202 RepID=A0ACB9IEM4_9ASTR|nr:hypothetical protein L1987_22292 [Smallanthus sonchifolius]